MTQFVPYSIGIAAENKPLNTRELNVVPIEVLSALDGELNYNPEEQVNVGTDSQGNQYEVKVITDVTLTASWLPSGSNRVTAPDVRRGELVEIYRLADTDQFYWRIMGLSDHLRRLETVIYAFNGSPDENTKGIDFETCYYFEISTHQKQVTFSTSKANGEPFRYTVQFNTNEGYVTLTDDVGNHFHLNSADTLIHLENADGAMVELNKVDINFHAPRDLNGTVGNNATIEVGNDFNLSVGNNATVQIGNNATVQVGGNATVGVGGDLTETVGGNKTETVSGNVTATYSQNFTQTVTGSTAITAQMFNITGMASGTITAPQLGLAAGTLGLTAAGGMSVSGASVSMGSSSGSVEVKGSTVELVGTVSASISCGSTSLVLTPSGAVLTAPKFEGVQG